LLIDPVQLKFRSLFSDLMFEINDITSRLKNVYEGNISGIPEELAEFEKQLVSTLLESGNIPLETLELRNILKTAHGEGQGGVNTLDRIFKSRVKYFSHKDFKRTNIFLIRNQIFADLATFDYSGIVDRIPKSKSEKSGSIAGTEILKDLKDLYYISSLLPDKSAVIKDPIILKAFTMNELAATYHLEKIQSDIHRLTDIFKGPISAIFLKDVIRLISKEPQLELEEKEYHSTFPKEIYDQIVEKYRIDREKFIHLENDKLLQTRMNSLFKERNLAGIQVYTVENSNLFHEAGLPNFKYIIPMRIIKSFLSFFFSTNILPVLQEFQIEAEFAVKKQKTDFQETVEYFEVLSERVKKFEEDLTIASFSEIHPFLEVLKNGFLDGAAKNKGREAVKKVNDRADKIIQDAFRCCIDLHGHLNNIIIDVNAAVPKLLSNAMFLNHKKEDLCKGLVESEELFKKFIKLLKIFAVHVDSARKSMQESV